MLIKCKRNLGKISLGFVITVILPGEEFGYNGNMLWLNLNGGCSGAIHGVYCSKWDS